MCVCPVGQQRAVGGGSGAGNRNRGVCELCEMGKFGMRYEGQSWCMDCPAGKYQKERGKSFCW